MQDWLQFLKCKTHEVYHWGSLVTIATGSALFSVEILWQFGEPSFRTWPWICSLAILAFVMSLASIGVFGRIEEVGFGRAILAFIPVLNLLFAIWLFLSAQDSIGVATTGVEREQASRPSLNNNVSPLKQAPDMPEIAPGNNDPGGAEKATAQVISPLAKAANLDNGSADPPSLRWYFLGSAGSALEIFPPPERISSLVTDAEAIEADWQTVAADLWNAFARYQPATPRPSDFEPASTAEL